MLTSVSLAAVTEVTVTTSASRATTGTSVTADVAVTASSSETSSVQLTSDPAGISITDPAAGSYQSVSLSTTPTTKTFTFTMGSAGSYTLTGRSGSQSGTATIVFVDPATLTVAGTPSSISKNAGESFTLTVTIQNPTSNPITTSYVLTCPSGITCSGDSTSTTITVGASSTTTLTWTATLASGISSGDKTITLQVGNNANAFSTTVTATASSSSSSSSSSGGGGGGGASVTVSKKLTINPGKAEVVKISQEDIGLKEILISVKNKAVNVEIKVSKLDGAPASVTREVTGKVYQYLEINKTNLTDDNLDPVKLKFTVDKSWLTNNSLDVSTVALSRYSNGEWNKLFTKQTSEDAKSYYFESESPGLSVFAITAEKVKTTEETTTTTTVTVPALTTTVTTLPPEKPKQFELKYVILVIALIVAVVAVAYLWNPQQKKLNPSAPGYGTKR